MAFPAPHYYFSFGGPLGSSEQWSCGLRVTTGGAALTRPQETTALEALEALMVSRWASADMPIGGLAQCSWLKLNQIGTDGRYVQDYTNVIDRVPLESGSYPATPLQTALVATLTTPRQRGLANKGRIYLPNPRVTLVPPDMTINETVRQSAANWVAGLVNGINGVEGLGFVCIASAVREGAIEGVTGVNVGSVVDTMRSRRNKVLEQRTESTVAITGGAGGGF